MVRETSQWEREEMEKVVSEIKKLFAVMGRLELELYRSGQQIGGNTFHPA